MPLPEDWRAFIESLNSNGVEYVVVGAVALAHHGIPRYTGDLDVLVRNSAVGIGAGGVRVERARPEGRRFRRRFLVFLGAR